MRVALKQHFNRDHGGESLRMVDVSVKHQDYLPEDVADLPHPQTDIPRIAKDNLERHRTVRRHYSHVSELGPSQMLETILASHSPRVRIDRSFQSAS